MSKDKMSVKNILLIMLIGIIYIFGTVSISMADENSDLSDTSNNINKTVKPERNSIDRNARDISSRKITAQEASGKNAAKIKIKTEFKAREIGADKIKLLNEDHDKIELKYKEKKENFGSVRSLFAKEKLKVKECNEKKNKTNECIESNKALKTYSIKYLGDVSDILLAAIEKIENRLNSSEDIDNATAQKLLETLSAKYTEVSAIKAKIALFNENTSKEDIVAVAKQLNELLSEIKTETKIVEKSMVNARVGLIIERAEHLEERLGITIEKMRENNISTSDIDEKVAEFKEKIADAKTKYNLANSLLVSISQSGDKKDSAKQAHEYIKQAQESLKEAHEILKDIVSEIKDAGGKAQLEDKDKQEKENETNEDNETD